MIDKKKLAELRKLVEASGERFDFGGLPLPDIFDTLESLWKENAELKAQTTCINGHKNPHWTCTECGMVHVLKLEAVARAAQVLSSITIVPANDLRKGQWDELKEALAALGDKP